ncbi:MAG: isoaspartyl peptidase/L-asparaginase [Roseiflexaceae bacterium]|nr:isoaspartyl peptidase/L-asparaginase [Roseiflexaceae bacterium]
MTIALIVHGGAWAIPDDEVAEHTAGCAAALEAGWRVLAAGGSALDAAETAVRVLEDAPIFDAGIGSVLNRDGFIEMDAAIMDGNSLRSGAVAAVQRVKNPITLARRVLESDVVLLVGHGAERVAASAGVNFCDPAALIVPREQQRFEYLRQKAQVHAQDAFMQHPGDTVGAVALDAIGNLAAATSTGGTAYKLPGRVGDSPLIGAGLYADNTTGGCSSTGWGESIIKVLLAKTATDAIPQVATPMLAAQQAVDILARRVGGYGGVILLDAHGRPGFAFNTPRMAYGYRTGVETVVSTERVV